MSVSSQPESLPWHYCPEHSDPSNQSCAGAPRIQEEMLHQMGAVQEHADYTSLKAELLPRCARVLECVGRRCF